jgi:uroporphyrinogen-III decarboxylase
MVAWAMAGPQRGMPMNDRDRMLAAIAGTPTDRLPWAPRMDLWLIAQRARGSLPAELLEANTVDLAGHFGFACHAVRGDFTAPRNPRDWMLRGFGIENHPDFPYRVEVSGLPVEFAAEGGFYRTTIRTAAGDATATLEMTPAMQRDGMSIPFVRKRPVETPADLEAVVQVFEHLEVLPTPTAYSAFRARIGEHGLALANGPIAASPVHLILHDLMDMESFIYLYMDEPATLHRFAERLTPFFEAALGALLQCEAEVVWWGANYDQHVTWPTFFRDEIVAWLRTTGNRLREKGKLLASHADGENERLLPLFPECQLDVAESVCPEPMTHNSLAELRRGMGRTTTVWGGIPSVALLDDSMSESQFAAYLDAVFADLGTGERLILGVSDNVPPNANLDRLTRISERVAAFGAVHPAS